MPVEDVSVERKIMPLDFFSTQRPGVQNNGLMGPLSESFAFLLRQRGSETREAEQ